MIPRVVYSTVGRIAPQMHSTAGQAAKLSKCRAQGQSLHARHQSPSLRLLEKVAARTCRIPSRRRLGLRANDRGPASRAVGHRHRRLSRLQNFRFVASWVAAWRGPGGGGSSAGGRPSVCRDTSYPQREQSIMRTVHRVWIIRLETHHHHIRSVWVCGLRYCRFFCATARDTIF